jgi:DNA-binding NarL/FixJ family response regulator
VLRVLIADDAELIRRGIKYLLKNHKDILVVGEAVDFSETLQKTAELQPDVLIIDFRLIDGTQNRSLTSIANELSVLAISFDDDPTTEQRARKLGATTSIDKMDLGAELIPALMKFLPPKSAD